MSSLKSTTRPTSPDRLLCGFLMCTDHGSADVMSVDISRGAIGVDGCIDSAKLH
jgi:hypothetical protein